MAGAMAQAIGLTILQGAVLIAVLYHGHYMYRPRRHQESFR